MESHQGIEIGIGKEISLSKLSIILTDDGSQTIKDEATGDTYHSIHGAVQESNHVFIQNGLHYFLGTAPTRKVRILEVGFGTGLNALLTLRAVGGTDVEVEYIALEPYPLESTLIDALNYSTDSNFKSLHEAKWHNPVFIAPNFSLNKMKRHIQEHDFLPRSFDLIYYDAFAPNSQPEMWTLEIFKRLKTMMDIPSVFVTYCAKGQVKRDLKSAGFKVEGIPGPPGKREMVRATVTLN